MFTTETWLNYGISDFTLTSNPNYAILRTDRKTTKKGGGVIAFVKWELCPRLIDSTSQKGIDFLLFETNMPALRILLIYVPPTISFKYDSLQFLSSYIGEKTSCETEIAIIGDFNMPSITWSNFKPIINHSNSSHPLVSCINYLDLKQIVRGPTRLGKTLDLILVKKIEIVTNSEISAPFVNSDHNSVIFEITVPHVPPKQILASSTILDFKLGTHIRCFTSLSMRFI
jgi:hypothetical protein